MSTTPLYGCIINNQLLDSVFASIENNPRAKVKRHRPINKHRPSSFFVAHILACVAGVEGERAGKPCFLCFFDKIAADLKQTRIRIVQSCSFFPFPVQYKDLHSSVFLFSYFSYLKHFYKQIELRTIYTTFIFKNIYHHICNAKSFLFDSRPDQFSCKREFNKLDIGSLVVNKYNYKQSGRLLTIHRRQLLKTFYIATTVSTNGNFSENRTSVGNKSSNRVGQQLLQGLT